MIELSEMFPTEKAAEDFFVKARWPNGVRCPRCDAANIQGRETRKPQPYRCRSCRKDFSVKTDSLMHNSPLGCRTWLLAIYLLTTNIKGVSSTRLRRELGITQKSAWHLAHRIRENFQDYEWMEGPIELDEAYFGGKEGNKHTSKKLNSGRGAVGKAIVMGAKDRITNKVIAEVVPMADKLMAADFLAMFVKPGAAIYTDEASIYQGLKNHATVCHSTGEFVKGMAHTNGIESFWSMVRRGYYGTYHRMSPKHLQRYIQEFFGRHNMRERDTIQQMSMVARGLDGKRLPYKILIG